MSGIENIVVENYPVDRLPDALRRGLETAGIVSVTIEQSTASPAGRRSRRAFIGSDKAVDPDANDAGSAIRALRDGSDCLSNGHAK